MSKSAHLPAQPLEPEDAASSLAWKQEVNQRLAAHRNRRGNPQEAQNFAVARNARPVGSRAADAAARVAARYAKAPSYSQLLAGEARAAARAAGAAAEAALNAQAAAEAVLAGLEATPQAADSWQVAEEDALFRPVVSKPQPPPHAAPARWQDEPPAPQAHTALPQPRWEEALPAPPQANRDLWSEMRVAPAVHPDFGADLLRREPAQRHSSPCHDAELFPEEAFDARDPFGSATVEPVEHLPANLIEFPRELVATRKARPRLAEGPLYDSAQENAQLSIFEVDPAALAPPVALDAPAASAIAPPEWASIELDHYPLPPVAPLHPEQVYASPASLPITDYASETLDEQPTLTETVTQTEPEIALHHDMAAAPRRVAADRPAAELLVARLSDRMLAAVVDGALITLSFLAAAVVVIASTAHPPAGRIALIASACGWMLFALLYQYLFLSYAEEGTPGMRYARIALCTFDDDNPTRRQMQMRIPAALLSALPAGLGLIWACFDGDRLGWHDRLTRTYQRKY